MDRCSSARNRSMSRAGSRLTSLAPRLLAVLLLLPWLHGARAMPQGRIARLRAETVDMFYHGFDNYMRLAFPEDEVGTCLPETGAPGNGSPSGRHANTMSQKKKSCALCPARP